MELYIQVLPSMIEVFFSLNRPNYARWGSYFLEKLTNLDKEALDVLKAGAFSTQRTTKAYSRGPIDLTVEQTVNRDAASSASGITHFANSHGAFRRWCVTLSQRSMAVSEMKEMSGIKKGETPANQLRTWRVEHDNNDVGKLINMLDKTCNPFATDVPNVLVNIATGKAANYPFSITGARHSCTMQNIQHPANLMSQAGEGPSWNTGTRSQTETRISQGVRSR